MKLKQEERNDINVRNEDNIHNGSGRTELSQLGDTTSTDRIDRILRTKETGIPGRESSRSLLRPEVELHSESSPGRYQPKSQGNARTTDGANEEIRRNYGANVGRRPDEMGRTDEQHNSFRSGDSDERSDLHLISN